MMRVWIICFFILFALAEFFKWLRGFSVPLPIYILGGVLLAVASNYDKIFGSYISNGSVITPVEISQEIPKLESGVGSQEVGVQALRPGVSKEEERNKKTNVFTK